MRKHQFLMSVLLMAVVGILGACVRMKSLHYEAHSTASPTPSPATSPKPWPTPIDIKPADLEKLHWIEGSWRGTGGDVAPFFERYKFENATTLVVETLEDEALSKVSDVSRFELKDGHFGYSGVDSGSVATALDDHSITFVPYGKAHNSFRWQRESDNSWKAILNWTDKTGAAKERIYNMQRWPARTQ
jgi:hypothetical protein